MSGPSFRRSARTISALVLIAVLAAACASSASPVPAGAGSVPAGASPSASAAEASRAHRNGAVRRSIVWSLVAKNGVRALTYRPRPPSSMVA